jgi:hypothetical protein
MGLVRAGNQSVGLLCNGGEASSRTRKFKHSVLNQANIETLECDRRPLVSLKRGDIRNSTPSTHIMAKQVNEHGAGVLKCLETAAGYGGEEDAR